MRRLRILLADDRPQILSLLQMVLEPDYAVVGTVEDGQSLIAAAQTLRPDLVLTDIDMPILNGIEATRELRRILPDCRVVVFSANDEPDIMTAAFAAGASGYLIKGSSQSLLSSIRTIVQHIWPQSDNHLLDAAAPVPPQCDRSGRQGSVQRQL
jgi:DNA-binding NarL/FixJ family response regulator